MSEDEQDTIEVVDAPGEHRWELREDGERIGMVTYRDVDGMRAFLHTEVDEAYGGRGLAGRLVAAALDDAAARDVPVVPLCPYVAGWLERHPDHGVEVVDDLDDEAIERFLDDD